MKKLQKNLPNWSKIFAFLCESYQSIILKSSSLNNKVQNQRPSGEKSESLCFTFYFLKGIVTILP